MYFCISMCSMKKSLVVLGFLCLTAAFNEAAAQCSICTKTAQQLGEKPAKALNGGIIYLAAMPLAIFGFITYKWMKHNKE